MHTLVRPRRWCWKAAACRHDCLASPVSKMYVGDSFPRFLCSWRTFCGSLDPKCTFCEAGSSRPIQDKRNPGDSAEAGDRSGVFASNPTGNPSKVNSVSTHVKGRNSAAPGLCKRATVGGVGRGAKVRISNHRIRQVRVRDTKSGANGALPRTSFANQVRAGPGWIQANDTPPLATTLSINP